MGLILLIVLFVLIFGGGGGYYAHRRYGTGGLGGVLGLVLVVLVVAWLFGGLGIGRTFPVLGAAAVSSLHPQHFAAGSAVNCCSPTTRRNSSSLWGFRVARIIVYLQVAH